MDRITHGKTHIISEAFRISIKYITIILGITIIQLSLNELNIFINAQSSMSMIITYCLMIIAPWGTLTLIHVVQEELKDRKIRIGEILTKVFSQFNSWVFSGIILYLLIIGLLFLLIIPGLIHSFYYSFVWQVFIFEKLKYKSALDSSKKFVKEKFKDIWAYFLLFFGFIILNSVASIFILKGIRLDNYPLHLLYVVCINIVMQFFTVLMTLVYLEHKGKLIYQQEEKRFILVGES